jgi:hypothetical protein
MGLCPYLRPYGELIKNIFQTEETEFIFRPMGEKQLKIDIKENEVKQKEFQTPKKSSFFKCLIIFKEMLNLRTCEDSLPPLRMLRNCQVRI